MESIEPVVASSRRATLDQIVDATPSPISFVQMGASGRQLVFLHANGYPPECYMPLLAGLAAEHRVWAMRQRPLWGGSRPEAVDSWRPLTDDLLSFLDELRAENVIAVGHSMGAVVALRAAMRAPEQFEGLVLLDPVLVNRRTMIAWRLFRTLGVGHRLHTKIHSALRRRRTFDDIEEAFRGYRPHEVFKYMSDEALRVMIAGLITPCASGGYELSYSPEWESRLYYTAMWKDDDIWDGLPGLKIPTLMVQGAESDTLTDSTCRAVLRANSRIQMATVERSSHLVPLERPEAVREIIRDFMRDSASASVPGLMASNGAWPKSARYQH